MRSWRIALSAMLACALLAVVMLAAACGGQTTTTLSGAATTIQVATTATPTTGTEAAATIETYRTQMKALWDQYGTKVSAMGDALSISDATNLSAAELASVQGFTEALRGFVTGLAKIKAPADLAGTHAKYLDVLSRLSTSFDKFYAAVTAKDNAALLTAAAEMATVVQNEDASMTAAEAALEKALGFSLGGTSTETSTTEAALGGDARTYTDATYGYTFQYPGAWQIDTGATTDATAGGSATGAVGAFDPSGTKANGTYVDLMVVSTYKLNLTITNDMLPSLESEIQNVLAGVEAQTSDVQIVSPLVLAEAAGLRGYTVTYTFTKDAIPTTATLYFLFKGDMEYQLSTQAATVDWDKNQNIFTAMVASFTAP